MTEQRAPTRRQLEIATFLGMSEKDAGRFWSRIEILGPDDCWPWHGQQRYGYGCFNFSDGHSGTASRLMLIGALGRELRPKHLACHRCDNPPCCNPAHLYEGTYVENALDAARAKQRRHLVILQEIQERKRRRNAAR